MSESKKPAKKSVKTPFNTRLTPEAHSLLADAAEKLGIGLTAALEIAIRDLAKKVRNL